MESPWNAALFVAGALCAVWLVGLLLFRAPEGVRIVLVSILLAVLYGIVHDQITARISIEYFTIGHPRLFTRDDPTPHALAWGVIATWWVGLILGVGLALAARRGAAPRIGLAELVRPLLILLGAMAASACASALVARFGAERGWFVLFGELARRVPRERQVDFITAGGAHGASYVVGFAGGALLVLRTWRRRRRASAALASGAH